MKRLFLAIGVLLLVACSASTPVSAQNVVDKFNEAGLQVSDVEPGERPEGTPLPNTYKENLTFVIAEVAPRGGQIFVCERKTYCDALMVYYDAIKALSGPYLYQSPNGLVVAQLNSGLTVETAEKFEKVIQGLP